MRDRGKAAGGGGERESVCDGVEKVCDDEHEEEWVEKRDRDIEEET